MEFLKELWTYLNARKKYWLFPVIVIILVLGVFLFLGTSSAVAPFIYAIF